VITAVVGFPITYYFTVRAENKASHADMQHKTDEQIKQPRSNLEDLAQSLESISYANMHADSIGFDTKVRALSERIARHEFDLTSDDPRAQEPTSLNRQISLLQLEMSVYLINLEMAEKLDAVRKDVEASHGITQRMLTYLAAADAESVRFKLSALNNASTIRP
jgi:hypothetical protein